MTNDDIYSNIEDEEMPYRLKDRVSDKRIEKRTKQAEARKNTKKGTRDEQRKSRKGTDARDVRALRQREVSILREPDNDRDV
jgi:ribosomal protein L19E